VVEIFLKVIFLRQIEPSGPGKNGWQAVLASCLENTSFVTAGYTCLNRTFFIVFEQNMDGGKV
jgi:hypothetical protein